MCFLPCLHPVSCHVCRTASSLRWWWWCLFSWRSNVGIYPLYAVFSLQTEKNRLLSNLTLWSISCLLMELVSVPRFLCAAFFLCLCFGCYVTFGSVWPMTYGVDCSGTLKHWARIAAMSRSIFFLCGNVICCVLQRKICYVPSGEVIYTTPICDVFPKLGSTFSRLMHIEFLQWIVAHVVII